MKQKLKQHEAKISKLQYDKSIVNTWNADWYLDMITVNCKIKHKTCIKLKIPSQQWKAIWDVSTSSFPLSWGCCSDFCQIKMILAQPVYQELIYGELADWQKSNRTQAVSTYAFTCSHTCTCTCRYQ